MFGRLGRTRASIGAGIAAAAVVVGAGGFTIARALDEDERQIVLTAAEPVALESQPTAAVPVTQTGGAEITLPVDDTYRLFVDDGIPTAEARMAAAAAEREVGGRALTVDREDGNRYEVDVALDDRSTAEVLLDERFRVLAVDMDGRYDD